MEALLHETTYPQYEAYKDSGVAWLGEIPAHWEVKRMKFIFREVSEKNMPDAELLSVTQDQGVVPRTWVENRMVMPSGGLRSFKFIRKGDFAISLRSFEGGLEYCYHDGIISPAYTVLRNLEHIDDGFYKYLFKSQVFISELQTSIVGIREGKNVSYEELRYSQLQLPPVEEQTAIAAFLDKKTAQIEAAIARKERQIELLKEHRQILIHRAVTRGLDPTVPMKDSGVEWIGEIPAHWEVRRLKTSIDLLTGFPFKSDKYSEVGIRLARGINVKEGYFDWSETRCWPSMEHYLYPFLLKDGDVLIGMDGSKVGKNFCKVTEKDLPILLLQRVARLRTTGGLTSDFLYNQIENIDFLNWVNMRKTDPMIPHIAPDDIENFIVLLPPIAEQELISDYIDTRKVSILKAIELKINEIQTLKELKSTLINAAVTGKLKVPGVA